MNAFAKGVYTGLIIVIACTIYALCENKYIGAFLFSFALCAICNLSMKLFTGEVGYVKNYDSFVKCLICLLGNVLGCALGATLIKIAVPEIVSGASNMMALKLQHNFPQTMILAMFCGMFMLIAVETFRKMEGFSKYIGIITCVPVFIICGFEHSIANFAYIFLSNIPTSLDIFLLLFLSVVGNTFGAIMFKKAIYVEEK